MGEIMVFLINLTPNSHIMIQAIPTNLQASKKVSRTSADFFTILKQLLLLFYQYSSPNLFGYRIQEHKKQTAFQMNKIECLRLPSSLV